MPNLPITPRYYPKLSDIVKSDRLPQIIRDFLFGASGNSGVLGKLYYRNLQIIQDESGGGTKYVLDIVSKEEIGFEILAGVEFVLNSGGNYKALCWYHAPTDFWQTGKTA